MLETGGPFRALTMFFFRLQGGKTGGPATQGGGGGTWQFQGKKITHGGLGGARGKSGVFRQGRRKKGGPNQGDSFSKGGGGFPHKASGGGTPPGVKGGGNPGGGKRFFPAQKILENDLKGEGKPKKKLRAQSMFQSNFSK